MNKQAPSTGPEGQVRAQRWVTPEKHQEVAFQAKELHTRKIILFYCLLHFLDGLETGFS